MVCHVNISDSPRVPTHWMCPYYNYLEFIPQEETIERILLRPSKTLAELRDNNFGGIAFYGPSGAGKTRVAIRFIQYYRRHTYDVFWVDASTPTTLAKDFQHISDLLAGSASTLTNFPHVADGYPPPPARSTDERLPVPEGPTNGTAAAKNTDNIIVTNDSSQESLLSTVKSKLESPSVDNWLLVLDNLTDETAIAKFLPKSSNGMIIVTTRSLHLASGLGCQVVEVPRMSPTNALSLFKMIYRSPDKSRMKQDEAMELMELLEYLPARITDAALHMGENCVSVREYLAELKTREEE